MATANRAASCCRKCSAPELVGAFREFKAIWDPDWKMNPGKIVRPYHRDRKSALRRTLRSAAMADTFSVSGRQRQFFLRARTLRRRRQMPRGTKAERCARATWSRAKRKHSTRGRARLLWEMLDGEVIGKERLAGGSSLRRARSLSRLQRLQSRLPGQCRHGDVQGGISFALL